MEDAILFVQDGSSFLINAIISQLTKENIQCQTVNFEVDSISKVVDKYPYVFITIEKDTAFKHSSELVYLKDSVGNSDRHFMLMGTPTDLEECSEILTENYIQELFIRPINTRDVVDRILSRLELNDIMVDRRNILVVDDSGTFLHTIREWLEPTYKVTMVSSATAAISYLSGNTPDLILLDYEMPICSGPKLLEMIRADVDNASIPVMFLTGKGDRESVQQVLALRPQGYLLKSLPREKILSTLEEFFASQQVF